jgi:hypothetical protein
VTVIEMLMDGKGPGQLTPAEPEPSTSADATSPDEVTVIGMFLDGKGPGQLALPYQGLPQDHDDHRLCRNWGFDFPPSGSEDAERHFVIF